MAEDRMIVLSASSVAEYLRCPRRYFYSHVWRLAGRQSMAAAIGVAVHAGVERLLRKSPLSPENALRTAFSIEVDRVPADEVTADPGALEDALLMYRTYVREVAPVFHPAMVEQPFAAEIGGITLTGTIDAADEDVRDLKTTAGKTINGQKPSFDPANYDTQLGIYDIGYEALTGRRPRRLVLDVLTRRGTHRQYVRSVDRGEVRDVLAVVRSGIMRGEYEPTGALSGACSWCPYAERCPDAVIT